MMGHYTIRASNRNSSFPGDGIKGCVLNIIQLSYHLPKTLFRTALLKVSTGYTLRYSNWFMKDDVRSGI